MTTAEKNARVEEMVIAAIGWDAELDFTTVQKNNTALHGVTIRTTAARVSPVIYYNPDDTIIAIADKIIATYQALPAVDIDPADYCKPDFILANVKPQIVALADNAAYLEGKAYTTFLDLAVVYRVWIGDNMSFVLSDIMREIAQLDMQDVHTAALNNLRKDVQILPLVEILREHMPDIPDEVAPPFIVATTKDRRYGAATMLLPEIQKALATRCGGDYWILPSSIHEILALPNSLKCTPGALADMIGEVNDTQVAPEERLNNHAYFYNSSRGVIELL